MSKLVPVIFNDDRYIQVLGRPMIASRGLVYEIEEEDAVFFLKDGVCTLWKNDEEFINGPIGQTKDSSSPEGDKPPKPKRFSKDRFEQRRSASNHNPKKRRAKTRKRN